MTPTQVRHRLRTLLASLRSEDLEDRVAPVKCWKHPDNPACDTTEYGVPDYGDPVYGIDPDYGVTPGDGTPRR